MTQESGSGEPCLTSELLDRNKTMGGSAEQQDIIKRVAAVAYSGELIAVFDIFTD